MGLRPWGSSKHFSSQKKKEPYAAPGRNNIWLVFYCKLYSDFVNIEFSLE